ncbi:MAG: GldG family protein [Gammaproteobacteria bacterium]|nr:GldG family protein [Gammaproteobacteria bacterium]
MEVTRTSRLYIRLQNVAFVALFLAAIGLLAWLGTRYAYQADWTANGRNTLSQASRALLDRIHGPVTITAYARPNNLLREHIQDLVGRYQRYKRDVHLTFVNPDTEPEQVRRLGITSDGELSIAYHGREAKVRTLAEQNLTNALLRVARGGHRRIVFITGHGERSPFGSANFDLGTFGREMQHRGFKLQTVNLAKTPQIPAGTTVLVIAGPQVNLLPGEVTLIERYIDQGGNLLWLAEPGDLHGLEPVASRLGVTFMPGVIVDANTQLFGIRNPTFALVADYPDTPITRDFRTITLFPTAAALSYKAPPGWRAQPFLKTLPRSWTYTGKLNGVIRYTPGSGERLGPLTLGLSLSRTLKTAPKNAAAPRLPGLHGGVKQQRVVILGDGDFLSNAYLGNGGNLNLGLNVMNWLSHDDAFLSIPAQTSPDLTLNLPRATQVAIGFGFLLVLPLLLAGTGVTIWLRRRRR